MSDAQDGLSTLPLVYAGDVEYLGSFEVPSTDGTSGSSGWLSFGGQALGMGAAGNTLLIGCHDWEQRLAEVSIPPIGGTASIVQRCRDTNLDGGFSGTSKIGGSLVWNGRTIVTGYLYYDAMNTATKSHSVLGGIWTRVGNVPAAVVAGYMGVVPPEWRDALGGPALTGQCCLSIISRTSSGPALSTFDPDDIGRVSPVPSTTLLYYPLSHPLDGTIDGRPLSNLSTTIGGVAFASGTRSVLFIGKIGIGEYCYGTGGTSGDCYDPVFSSKGEHMFPYIHQVWAYDANDLVKVKSGLLQPYQVRPYATWRLTDMNDGGSASMRPGGMTFDPTTRRIYVTDGYDEAPRVHVYHVAAGHSSPPAEVCGDGIDNDGDGQTDEDCAPSPVSCTVSSWSSWQATTDWSACDGGSQTRTEQRTRSIVTPPSGGGAACPALVETRTATRACTSPPPVVSCTVSSWSGWQATTAWSACDGGSQTRTEQRTRSIVTPPSGGGSACPALVETRTATSACALAPPAEVCGDGVDNDRDGQVDEGCPVACAVSSWSAWQPAASWSACSANGVQTRPETRSRSIVTAAANGGAACPLLQESRTASQSCLPSPPREVEACGDSVDNDHDGDVDEDCPVVQDPQPGAPAQLTGFVDGTTVNFAWLEPISGGAPTHYVLEAGMAPGETIYSAPLPLNTKAQVAGVGDGHYFVRVRAANASGLGAPSNEIALTVGCSGTPRRPEGLVARTRGPLVSIAWSDPSGCMRTQYRVRVGVAPGQGNLAQLFSTNHSINALAAPGRYYARVSTITPFGESMPSDEIEIAVGGNTCIAPPVPVSLSARVSGGMVLLEWNPTDLAAAAAADSLSPFSYVLEVGSAPGLANLGRIGLGRSTSFATPAPAGTYYVRVRTTDICGMGPASPERLIHIR